MIVQIRVVGHLGIMAQTTMKALVKRAQLGFTAMRVLASSTCVVDAHGRAVTTITYSLQRYKSGCRKIIVWENSLSADSPMGE